MKKGLTATAAVALLALAGCSTDLKPETVAKNECHDQVKSRLKDGSAADFETTDIHAYGDDVYRVEGIVRSPNSFGANVTGRYGCVVTVNGNEGTAGTVRVNG